MTDYSHEIEKTFNRVFEALKPEADRQYALLDQAEETLLYVDRPTEELLLRHFGDGFVLEKRFVKLLMDFNIATLYEDNGMIYLTINRYALK